MKPLKGVDVSEIIPNFLYLGSSSVSKDFASLDALGITHIFNLAGNAHFPDRFEYVQFHFKDSYVDLFPEVLELLAKIDELEMAGKAKVLVHCLGGVSRSPSVVIGYLMQRDKVTFSEAYERVKSKRKGIRPNKSFEAQLIAFERDILPQ